MCICRTQKKQFDKPTEVFEKIYCSAHHNTNSKTVGFSIQIKSYTPHGGYFKLTGKPCEFSVFFSSEKKKTSLERFKNSSSKAVECSISSWGPSILPVLVSQDTHMHAHTQYYIDIFLDLRYIIISKNI